MLKVRRFFLLFFILFLNPAFALTHPSSGGWTVGAEFLYLLPSVDDTYFVIKSPISTLTTVSGSRKNCDFGFHSGFRVGLARGLCECDQGLEFYYTRFEETRKRTISGGSLWATTGAPRGFLTLFNNYSGFASARLETIYHRFDAFFSQKTFCCCGFEIYVLPGFELAHIRFDEHYTYQSVVNRGVVVHHTKTIGVGPQFALEFDYDLYRFTCFCPGSLSLVARTSGSLLASKSRSQVSNFLNTATPLDVRDELTWRFIPTWHARVGFNYETCFRCWNAAVEVGYEFNTYVNGLSRLFFVDDVQGGLSRNEHMNFALHGLYVALNIGF